MSTCRAVAACLVLLAPGLALAAEKPPEKPKAEKAEASGQAATVLYEVKPATSLFDFDYGPPQSPALKLVGLTSESTTPSTSLTKFVLSTPSLFSGEAGQTIALDMAPAALLPSRGRAVFNTYVDEENYGFRLLHRTRFNVAAMNGDAAGGDASKAVRSKLAWGFSASVLDSADPLVTGRRRGAGVPLLVGCLNALTPTVNAVLKTTSQVSDAYLVAANKRTAFARAKDDLKQSEEVSDSAEKAKLIRRARDRVAAYLPGAVTSQAPVVTSNGDDDAKPSPADTWYAEVIAKAKASNSYTAGFDLLAQEMREMKREKEPRERPKKPAEPPAPVAEMSDADFIKAINAEVRRIEKGEGAATAVNAEIAANNTALASGFKDSGVDDGIDRCTLLASRAARFSPDLDVGFGTAWRGDPGKLDNLKSGGSVLWAAFKFPIGVTFPVADEIGVYGQDLDQAVPKSAWLAAISGRYGHHEWVQTKNETTPEIKANTIDAWVGLERLTQTTRFAIQYGWYDLNARDVVGKPFEKDGERYLASAQFRLPLFDKGVWLGLSYGNAYGTAADLDDKRALVTISYTPPGPVGIAEGKTKSK